MKKTTVSIVLSILLIVSIALIFVACGQKDETTQHAHSYSNESVTKVATYNADGVKTYTCSCGETRTEKIDALMPTKTIVAEGIATAKNAEKQNYDFEITLEGNVSILGFTGSASGVYSGKYRYDAESGSLKFMRETSGKLLYAAKEYVFNKGDSRIVINADPDDNVKKISITADEEDLDLMNLPFLSLVHSLGENNIENLTKNVSGKYRFQAAMAFSVEATPIQLLLDEVTNLGSTLSVKEVSFNNPQGGVILNFNLTDDGVLADFAYSIDVSFPVAGQDVSITITYEQAANDASFEVPELNGYLTDDSEIGAEVTAINAAIAAVRDSATYSVDLTATNDLDAGWNKLSVVDKYVARMYKNTNDDREDFNHSYTYKAHTEEDGKESFQYTVGNVVDENKVYEISRKGSNTQTEREGVTAADRFDLLTSFAKLQANEVDFIKKEIGADGVTTYKVFFNNASSLALQKSILSLLNSNPAEGVVPVENYLDEENYTIESGEYALVVKDGKLVSADISVELRYTPTDGEYTDRIVTLKNGIEIAIGAKQAEAAEYVAPNKVNTTIGKYGLNNSKYYIL